jgi:DNA-binding Lrp family transcriptional regulator
VAKSSLIPSNENEAFHDPFGKRSGLILFWILSRDISERFEPFSINEVAQRLAVGTATVHRTIVQLVKEGIFKAEGIRTSKRYCLKKSDELLIDWIKNYQFSKKIKKIQLGISDHNFFSKKEVTFFEQYAVPALHTAARKIFKVGASNLNNIEAYVENWNEIEKIESNFKLVEQERGYEVLLLKPYYDRVISNYRTMPKDQTAFNSYALLTFLDLINYPVRGREQAESLFRKTKTLSSICSWSQIEDL